MAPRNEDLSGALVEAMSVDTEERTFGWRSLLLLAAWAELVILVLTGVALRDKEAAGLAAVVGAGLVLLRFRRGKGGMILLGLLFLNIAFWTLAGAASNAAHREELVAFLLPASHAAVALIGIVAPFALIFRRAAPRGGRPVVVAAVAALALVGAMVAGAARSGGGERQFAQLGDVRVQANNTAYSTSKINVSSGKVGVFFTNGDLFWHTFTIDEYRVDLKVPVKGSRRITFTARPGTYTFYCRIPGHTLAGMKGTLVVD